MFSDRNGPDCSIPTEYDRVNVAAGTITAP
jgi:hypothetical protein